MERGGLTRRRGYMWLVAVLSVLLLIVVYINRRPAPAQSPVSVTVKPAAPAAASASNRVGYRKPSSGPRAAERDDVASSSTTANHRHWESARKPFIVSLNSADSLDLVQLYNIGPAFARRILKYRALLGGFVSKEQLMEVYGMDSARYNDIAPHITIDASDITTIDVNTATIDQLKRHPYLDYYQAKAIVRHREQAEAYHDISELRQVALIDNETYNKISLYLVCNLQPSK